MNVLCALTGEAQDGQRFEFAAPKMGTTFRLIFYADDTVQAEAAARAAFARIDELNEIFSDYREDSELSRLSDQAGSGKKVPVSPEMWEVLHFSRGLSRKSRGAFDPTVGPLSKLWRRAFRRREFPGEERIAAARALVNYRDLKLYRKRRRVKLRRAGMRLDLGGVAKGYTVDAVFRVLSGYGIERALIDGGGDIFAGAPPPGQSGWEISLLDEPPGAQVEGGKKLVLRYRAIASSGATYRFLEWQGVRYSHIIDPRTGLGVTKTSIVNVSADSCMLADALASALSVLNPLERTHLLDRFPGVALIGDQ